MQYSHVVPSHPCGFKACVCVGEMVPFLPGRHLHWHHWSITSPSWVSRKNCHLLPFGWWYKQCPTWHCPIKQDNSLTALNRSDYNSVNWIHKKALQINPQTLHIWDIYRSVRLPFTGLTLSMLHSSQKIHTPPCLFPKLTLSSQSGNLTCSLNPTSVAFLIFLHNLEAAVTLTWYIELEKKDQTITTVCGTHTPGGAFLLTLRLILCPILILS